MKKQPTKTQRRRRKKRKRRKKQRRRRTEESHERRRRNEEGKKRGIRREDPPLTRGKQKALRTILRNTRTILQKKRREYQIRPPGTPRVPSRPRPTRKLKISELMNNHLELNNNRLSSPRK